MKSNKRDIENPKQGQTESLIQSLHVQVCLLLHKIDPSLIPASLRSSSRIPIPI